MRHSHHKSHSKVDLVACLSALLFMGIASTASADTELDAYIDGVGVTAFAISSDDVLSINIRVVGPEGYVYEERAEDSSIEWMPESNLPDGLYTWEVWTVTAERGAPMREISVPRQSTQAVQSVDSISPHQPSDQAGTGLEEIPLERFFAPQDKNVHIESGSFRVTDGRLETLDDEFLGSTDNCNPNAVQRLIGGILDLLVPSAHAQNFTDDVIITKANPSVILDSSASVGQNWSIQGATSLLALRDLQNSNTVIGFVPGTANTNALRITDTGNVGLGTAAATEALHIADSNPRIRLQNLGDAQTWYVKNTNQGRFEISETSDIDNPFSIEAGAPASALYVGSNGNIGLGTDEPQRNLHILGNHIRIEDSNSTWDLNPGSQGLWFNQANPTTFGVLKLQNDAPANSIVATADGIGIGTANPVQKLHVDGNAYLSGSVGVGTTSPSHPLHLSRADGSARVFVNETSGTTAARTLFDIRNNGATRFVMENTNAASGLWTFAVGEGSAPFVIGKVGTGVQEMVLSDGGDMTIGGTLTENSSRSVKQDITEVDATELLTKLAALEISEWSYNNSPQKRHVGPMAEDWFALFEFGANDKGVSPRDLAGVALAAIKGLKAENDQLKVRLEHIESMLDDK